MYIDNLLFLNLGTQEIVLIMFAVLLLFGGEKLPELAKGLGKGLREFKDASDGVKREIQRNINELTADEELKREEEIGRSGMDVEEFEGIVDNDEPEERKDY